MVAGDTMAEEFERLLADLKSDLGVLLARQRRKIVALKRNETRLCTTLDGLIHSWPTLTNQQKDVTLAYASKLTDLLDSPFIQAASAGSSLLAVLVRRNKELATSPKLPTSLVTFLKKRLKEEQAVKALRCLGQCIHKDSECVATILQSNGLRRLVEHLSVGPAGAEVFQDLLAACTKDTNLRQKLSGNSQTVPALIQALQAGPGCSHAAALGLVICTQPDDPGSRMKLRKLIPAGDSANPSKSKTASKTLSALLDTAKFGLPADEGYGGSADIISAGKFGTLAVLERLVASRAKIRPKLIGLGLLESCQEWVLHGEDHHAWIAACIASSLLDDLSCDKVQAGAFIPLFAATLGRRSDICQAVAIQSLAVIAQQMNPKILVCACLHPIPNQGANIEGFPHALTRLLSRPLKEPKLSVLAKQGLQNLPRLAARCWIPPKPWSHYYCAVNPDRRSPFWRTYTHGPIWNASLLINSIAQDKEGAQALISAGIGSAMRHQVPSLPLLTAYRSLVTTAETSAPSGEDVLGIGIVPWLLGLCNSPDNSMKTATFALLAALLPKCKAAVCQAFEDGGLTSILCAAAVQGPDDPRDKDDCEQADTYRQAALSALPYVSHGIRAMDTNDSLLLFRTLLSPNLHVTGGAAAIAQLIAEAPSWGVELLDEETALAGQDSLELPSIVSGLYQLAFPDRVNWTKPETFTQGQRKEACQVRTVMEMWLNY
jgi:hypothetical protein